MDIHNKLDEDFLFYLGFTNSFSQKLKDCDDKMLAQQWLQKLCGETFHSVDEKRNRNIFLSNLLLAMQEGRLSPPFDEAPDNVNLSDPKQWFPTIQGEIQAPAWLDDVVGGSSGSKEPREDGRTYVATRTMPDGDGAFAYIAVSMAEDEPMWLGGGEGVFDKEMARVFKSACPPPNEMEAILARRKDPKERQRVITFYEVMLQNIADELDERISPENNQVISVVLEQLIADLKARNAWADYELMDEKNRRIELLLLLFDRTHSRMRKVIKREEYLDEIDATFRQSFFEASLAETDDKYELPEAMWDYAINRPPGKKNMENMQIQYPPFVVEKFLELLADYKESVAMRISKRHQSVVSQMKRELRKEGEKLKRWVEDAKVKCDNAVVVFNAVVKAYEEQLESEKAMQSRRKGGETELTSLYNELRTALYSTQQVVEEEAERGRELAEQINAINQQSDDLNNVNEESIKKTEKANIDLMKNIKRLNAQVQMNENRLSQLEMIKESVTRGKQTAFIF